MFSFVPSGPDPYVSLVTSTAGQIARVGGPGRARRNRRIAALRESAEPAVSRRRSGCQLASARPSRRRVIHTSTPAALAAVMPPT